LSMVFHVEVWNQVIRGRGLSPNHFLSVFALYIFLVFICLSLCFIILELDLRCYYIHFMQFINIINISYLYMWLLSWLWISCLFHWVNFSHTIMMWRAWFLSFSALIARVIVTCWECERWRNESGLLAY